MGFGACLALVTRRVVAGLTLYALVPGLCNLHDLPLHFSLVLSCTPSLGLASSAPIMESSFSAESICSEVVAGPTSSRSCFIGA